jgi:hypothetical protein
VRRYLIVADHALDDQQLAAKVQHALATSPPRVTRLLAMDLQHRVHRSFGLPVTVLGMARTQS